MLDATYDIVYGSVEYLHITVFEVSHSLASITILGWDLLEMLSIVFFLVQNE